MRSWRDSTIATGGGGDDGATSQQPVLPPHTVDGPLGVAALVPPNGGVSVLTSSADSPAGRQHKNILNLLNDDDDENNENDEAVVSKTNGNGGDSDYCYPDSVAVADGKSTMAMPVAAVDTTRSRMGPGSEGDALLLLALQLPSTSPTTAPSSTHSEAMETDDTATATACTNGDEATTAADTTTTTKMGAMGSKIWEYAEKNKRTDQGGAIATAPSAVETVASAAANGDAVAEASAAEPAVEEPAEPTVVGRVTRRTARATTASRKKQLSTQETAQAAEAPLLVGAVAQGAAATGETATETTSGGDPPLLEAEELAPAQPPPPPTTAITTRDKRRAPPRPTARAAPPKKSKKMPHTPAVSAPTTSTRPKRTTTAMHVVDVTMLNDDEEEEEDDEEDVEMVIADHATKVSFSVAAPPSSPSVGVAVGSAARGSVASKTKKRKATTISERQLKELMDDDRRPRASMPPATTDPSLQAIANVVVKDPSHQATRACEFCHTSHTAHPRYHCYACKRVYHDKCLIDAFRSETKDDEPLDQQMERLRLYRPQGHSAILRCTSCVAAFRDIHSGCHFQWDCTCPTCTSAPQKTTDYRRVMLKRIIDEHNASLQLKKEQSDAKKGIIPPSATAAAKAKAVKAKAVKTPAKAAAKTVKTKAAVAAVVPTQEEAQEEEDVDVVMATEPVPPATTSRSARAGRGSRAVKSVRGGQEESRAGSPPPPQAADDTQKEQQQQQSRDDVPPPPPQDGKPRTSLGRFSVNAEKAKKPKKGAATKATTQAVKNDHGDGDSETMAMQVEDHRHWGGHAAPAKHDAETQQQQTQLPTGTITLENLEELVTIKKEDDQTWTFRIACSPSAKSNESGSFKEARFVWHPTRKHHVVCCCCDNINTGKPNKSDLSWFVEHTDAKLLEAAKVEQKEAGSQSEGIYKYLFVLQKSNEMVPLPRVLRVIRQRYALVNGGHLAITSSPKTGKAAIAAAAAVVAASTKSPSTSRRRSSGSSDSAVAGEKQQALQQLSEVAFRLITPPPPPPASHHQQQQEADEKKQEDEPQPPPPAAASKKRTTAKKKTQVPPPPPQFLCEVVCTEDKFLRPIGQSGTTFRLLLESMTHDVHKSGVFVLCDSVRKAKTTKIECLCCHVQLTLGEFTRHALEPLQQERRKRLKDLKVVKSELGAKRQQLEALREREVARQAQAAQEAQEKGKEAEKEAQEKAQEMQTEEKETKMKAEADEEMEKEKEKGTTVNPNEHQSENGDDDKKTPQKEEEEVEDEEDDVDLERMAELLDEETVAFETESSAVNQVVSGVTCVRLRDGLSGLKLEVLMGVLDKLGSQAEINDAIAGLVKTQEAAAAPVTL